MCLHEVHKVNNLPILKLYSAVELFPSSTVGSHNTDSVVTESWAGGEIVTV